MSFTLEYNHDEKVLYCDNTMVGRTKCGAYFVSIYVTEKGASIFRYCVPGRMSVYSFDYIPKQNGLGSRIAFFTETGTPLGKAFKKLKEDLKRKEVKTLIKKAFVTLGNRNYLTFLLETL